MGFCYTDIKKTIGEFFSKISQTGSITHCRGNCHQIRIFCSKIRHGITEYLRIGQMALLFYSTGFRIKWSDAVKFIWIFLCSPISLTFLCDRMNHDRTADMSCHFQNLKKFRNIVPVHRTKIRKPKLLKNNASGKQCILDTVFHMSQTCRNILPDLWYSANSFLNRLFGFQIAVRRPEFGEMLRKTSDIS